MSELASPDGVLAKAPDGGIALAFDVSTIDAETAEHFTDPDPGARNQRYVLLGRSSLALVAGIGVSQAGRAAMVEGKLLYVPSAITDYTDLGSKVVERIHGTAERAADGQVLTWHDERLGFGRILDQGGLERLEEDELQYAAEESFIGFGDAAGTGRPPFRIVDGMFAVPLALHELKPHPSRLEQPRNMLDLVLHGRSFAMDNVFSQSRQPGDTFREFTVGTVLFSPGPYHCRVVGAISPDGSFLRQEEGASRLDDNRMMGYGDHIPPKRRGQHVELVNEGLQSRQTWGESDVLIEVYRSKPLTERVVRQTLSPIVNWEDLTPAKRQKIHRNGYNLAQIIEPVLGPLLDTVQGDNYAAVITPKRFTEVADDRGEHNIPDDPDDDPNVANIRDAILSSGQRMETPPHLQRFRPLQDKLGLATNNPRVIITREITPANIAHLMQQGDPRLIVVQQDGEIVIDAEDEAALLELTRQGKTIAWHNDGDLQILHPTGFRATRKDGDRISEDITTFIAMFGSHLDGIGELQRDSIRRYVSGLIAGGIPAAELALIHGDGPGIMRVSGEEGQLQNVYTAGAGMDFGQIGQHRTAEQKQTARSVNGKLSRLPRQGKLLSVSDWRKYWIGGAGTAGEEFGIDITNVKLQDCFPSIFSMIGGEHYKDLKNQFDRMATLDRLEFDGQVIDLGDTRLLQPWVARAIRLYRDVEDVVRDDVAYYHDPGAFWQEIGVSKREIEVAYHNRRDTLNRLNRPVDNPFTRAAEQYIS